jgi:nucleotide-binding universal stress UspA family protein
MKSKCNILVLSDVDKSASKILKNAINLAKIVGGNINFLCVKKPTEIVEKDSQLSAMRAINEKFLETDNQIKSMITALSTDEKIKISHKISFGNLKDEIGKQIKESKPDIIVLGKQKSKILSFLGDNIIDFVLKKFSGTVLITSNKITLEANSKLSLGILNNSKIINTNRYKEALVSFATIPLKAFQISSKTALKNDVSTSNKIIEFIFEEGDNAIRNMDNYLLKNNIQLLFASREKNKISSLSSRINCAIMFTN